MFAYANTSRAKLNVSAVAILYCTGAVWQARDFLERLETKKDLHFCRSFYYLLQARLELAPRVDPDWILSPTRLPIPPLELNRLAPI